MPREIRISQRGGGGARYTDNPTVGLQDQARAIPKIQSDRAGLESLSDSFGKFFGAMTKVSETLGDIEAKKQEEKLKDSERRDALLGWEDSRMGHNKRGHQSEAYSFAYDREEAQERVGEHDAALVAQKKARIEQAKVQGLADAQMGKPQDASFADVPDYATTYSETLGTTQGNSMAADFTVKLANAPIGTDPEELYKEYVRSEFGNGTGNAHYDGAALATLNKSVQPEIEKWRVNRVKQVNQLGREKLADVIQQRVISGNVSMDDVTQFYADAAALHPGEESNAKGWATGILFSSATTPQALHNLQSIVHQPGIGPNGESLYQLFPAAMAEAESKAVKNWQALESNKSMAYFTGLNARLDDPTLQMSTEDLFQALEDSYTFVDRYGAGFAELPKIQAKVYKKLEKHAEGVAEVNTLREVVTGQRDVYDQTLINKAQLPLLKLNGIEDPLADQESAVRSAAIVFRSKGIAKDLKGRAEFALIDTTNPARQANAYHFLAALESQGMDVGLEGKAGRLFDAMGYILRSQDVDPAGAFARLAANPKLLEMSKPESFKWSTIYGTPEAREAESRVKAQGALRDAMVTAMGLPDPLLGSSKVIISAHAERDLLWDAGARAFEYQQYGMADPTGVAFAKTAERAASRFLALPVEGGNLLIVPNDIVKKPGLVLPGVSRNPITGENENTTETFRADSVNLRETFPGTVGDTFVSMDAQAKRTGVFTVMNGSTGQPIVFYPGQTMTRQLVGSTAFDRWVENMSDQPPGVRDAVALQKDPESSRAKLQALLPKGFEIIVREDPVNGPYFMVGYKFRHKDAASLERMGQDWASKQQKARTRQQVIPSTTESQLTYPY
jgi:hypothetical protein